MFVVGTFWVGWAARLGHEQNVFWILAILTFYLPLAVAVIFLNRLMPHEGGLYQWSKLAFNDFVAFMVGWNLWVFAITILAGIGLVVTTNISYAIGPAAAWMKDSTMDDHADQFSACDRRWWSLRRVASRLASGFTTSAAWCT